MKVSVVGLDLAKNVFQVHGVDERGDLMLRKQLRRNQVLAFFAQRERCLIGMEACSGAHYWARELRALGHAVRLMAPQFVKPYVKANKTDAAEAEAICEAVTRPSMRFVPIKSEAQQAVLALHRARSGFVKAPTALINQIRGLLTEYGIVLAVGTRQVRVGVPALLEDGERNRRRFANAFRSPSASGRVGWPCGNQPCSVRVPTARLGGVRERARVEDVSAGW